MDGSSTYGHYFWQSPILRTTTTNAVTIPSAVYQVQNNNINANINFVSNSSQITNSGIAQVNAIAQQVQNSTTNTTGPIATQVQVQTGTNSQGLPSTTTIQTQSQPIQIVTVTSNITINLSTYIPNGPVGQQLLSQRYNNLRKQLINQGVSAANINQGTLNYGQTGLPNGNQTSFNIQTNTTTQNGTQTNTTTTTSEYTYGNEEEFGNGGK